jgi:hypothetical protein
VGRLKFAHGFFLPEKDCQNNKQGGLKNEEMEQ